MKRLNKRAVRTVSARALAALTAAVRGDVDAAVRFSTAIGEQYGTRGMYLACCGWAEVFRQNTVNQPPADGYGFGVSINGVQVDPGSVPAEARPTIWAFRFLSAASNRDAETTLALITLPDRVLVAEGAAELLGLATVALIEAGQ